MQNTPKNKLFPLLDKLVKMESGMTGFLAVISALGAIFIPLALVPDFSWKDSALSNFGFNPITAPFFNAGIVLTGILLLVSNTTLLKRFELRHFSLPGIANTIALICLIITGLTPSITYRLLHNIAARIFFILYPLGITLFGISVKEKHKGIGIFSITIGVLALVGLVILVPFFNNLAIPEIYHTLLISFWIIVTSL